MKMIMRCLTVCLLMVLFTSALGSQGVSAQERESAYERVLKTGILRCAYTVTPPYADKDLASGDVTGIMPDIAEAMADELELEIEWAEEVGFADFAEGLKTGRYDAFCSVMSIMPTRARQAAFTMPTLYAPRYVYARAGEDRYTSLEDVNQPDVTAATIDGETYQKATQLHLPNVKEYNLPNLTPQGQLFVDVVHGKADVVIHDPLVKAQFAQANPGQIERLFTEPLEAFPVGFAVNPYEEQLVRLLDSSLQLLHDNGTIDQILNSHGIEDHMLYRLHKRYIVPGL